MQSNIGTPKPWDGPTPPGSSGGLSQQSRVSGYSASHAGSRQRLASPARSVASERSYHSQGPRVASTSSSMRSSSFSHGPRGTGAIPGNEHHGEFRQSTAASEVSRASRSSRRSSSVGGRSGLGEPRPSSNWQVPTRSVLGGNDDASSYSDTSSVRTATTIREFFDQDRQWARGGGRSGRGYEGRHLPPGPLSRMMAGGAADAPSGVVLPCVPPGKIPGGRPPRPGPSKADILYAPRPITSNSIPG